jgi:hypothetical protein
MQIKLGVSYLDCDLVLPTVFWVRLALRSNPKFPICVWRGDVDEQILQCEFAWDIGTRTG